MGLLASFMNLVGPDLVIVALFFLPPIIIARLLNRRHGRLRPKCRPYAWGYWLGLTGFFAPIFAMGPVANHESQALGSMFIVAVIYYPLSILTLLRNRWGLLLLTIFSLNPVIWIINALYIPHRWAEMASCGHQGNQQAEAR